MKSTDQQGMYGPELISRFRVAAGGCLTLDWPEKSTFAITRISSDIGLSDFTGESPLGPAVLMAVAIKPVAAKDFQHRFNGKAVKTPSLPAFATSVLDARGNPMCFVGSDLISSIFTSHARDWTTSHRITKWRPSTRIASCSAKWTLPCRSSRKTYCPYPSQWLYFPSGLGLSESVAGSTSARSLRGNQETIRCPCWGSCTLADASSSRDTSSAPPRQYSGATSCKGM